MKETSRGLRSTHPPWSRMSGRINVTFESKWTSTTRGGVTAEPCSKNAILGDLCPLPECSFPRELLPCLPSPLPIRGITARTLRGLPRSLLPRGLRVV